MPVKLIVKNKRKCSCPPNGVIRSLAKWKKDKIHEVHICSACGKMWTDHISKALTLKTGQRWITIHPNGEEETGVPVLIQEHPDGTASIIRGAGGKLNYLRLNRIKSKEEWKDSRKENKERKEAHLKERMAGMSDEEKKKEAGFRKDLIHKKNLRDAEFVQTIMEAHGIAPEQWKLPEKVLEAMPTSSRNLAEKRHIRKMVKVAKELTDQARQDILAAQDKVIEQAFYEVPTEDILPPDSLPGSGKGYVAAVAKKAAENGLTAKQQAGETADISWRHFLEAAEGNEEDALAKKAAVARLHDALAQTREPVTRAQRMGLLDVDIKPEQPQVEDIAKILLAEKKQREAEKQYKQIQSEVAESGVPKAAFVVAEDMPDMIESKIEPMSDEQAKVELGKELDEDMMQIAASRLIESTDKENQAAPLREHISVGHYDAINSAALAVTDSPCAIDRVTADILGPAASAQVLVEGWRRDMSPDEFKTVREGVIAHHTTNQRHVADEASKTYEDACKRIDEIEIPKVTDADSLMQAQLANDAKADLLIDARRSLGLAMGKLEGEAAIVKALEEGKLNEVKVSLGAIGNDQAVAQARVLGITGGKPSIRGYVLNKKGEKIPLKSRYKPVPNAYRIDSDGINKFLTIPAEGIDRLIGSQDKEFAKKSQVALAIKRGDYDVDGWLPEGIVSRPATTFDDPHERAMMITEPLQLNEGMAPKELKTSLEDYIGSRLADGQDPESLRSDLLSAEFVSDIPKTLIGSDANGAYYKALKDLGFFSYKQVENATGEELAKRADAIVEKRRAKLGDSANIAALNSQSIPLSEATYEAVHRALAKVPHAQIISKGTGELTPQDKGVLRDYFWTRMTDEKPPVAAETRLKNAEAEIRANEVVAHQYNIFGGIDEVKRTMPEEAEKPQEHAWDRYVHAMGSTDRAYQAIQDLTKGEFMQEFAKNLGSVTGTEFKTGTKRIANWDRHILGILSPDKQERLLGERLSNEKRKQAQVATRIGGKFSKEEAGGMRKQRAEKLLQAMRQSQMGLFKAGSAPSIERVTIGDRAEAQLKKVFPMVAANFDPKKPVEIPHDVSMSGKFAMQQRSIKLFEANKRLGLHLGVGSGKSLVALGSFAHLNSKGTVKRAIMTVPSIVQAQFGSESLRYFSPGRYSWFANPAASGEERRAAYSDSKKDIVVVTHQALRDDLTKLLADQKFGGNVEATSKWLMSSTEKERKTATKQAMDKAGWNFDMSVIDEGHDLLNRRGKPNSRMANSIDSMTFNTPYYLEMTADPIKNDSSEAWNMLHKIDPDRYNDADAFHAKYGIDTDASKVALQQEMMPYTITGRIRPNVTAERITKEHNLLPEQSEQYRGVLANYRKANQAQKAGRVDVEAVKALSPHAFRGLSEAEQTVKAKQLSEFLAITRDSALDRIVNNGSVDKDISNASCAKLKDALNYVGSRKTPDGKQAPGIIFAHSLDSVARLKKELGSQGLKVLTLTGKNTGADKEKNKLAFQAGKADVIVMSDAGAVGANLQRAHWVYQYDTPDTAKTHEQRIGRMERLGQENPDIEAVDAVSNTPYEARRRKRFKTKNALREVFTAPTETMDDTGLAHSIWTKRQERLQKDIVNGTGSPNGRITYKVAAAANKSLKLIARKAA